MTTKNHVNTEAIAALNLTELETKFLTAYVGELYAEAHFSDVDCKDVAKIAGIPVKQARGVLGSLIKKGILNVQDSGTGFEIVYLNEPHFNIHNEWFAEIGGEPAAAEPGPVWAAEQTETFTNAAGVGYSNAIDAENFEADDLAAAEDRAAAKTPPTMFDILAAMKARNFDTAVHFETLNAFLIFARNSVGDSFATVSELEALKADRCNAFDVAKSYLRPDLVTVGDLDADERNLLEYGTAEPFADEDEAAALATTPARFTITNADIFRQAEAEIHGVSVTVTQPKGQTATVRFGIPLAGRTAEQIREVAAIMNVAADLADDWNA